MHQHQMRVQRRTKVVPKCHMYVLWYTKRHTHSLQHTLQNIHTHTHTHTATHILNNFNTKTKVCNDKGVDMVPKCVYNSDLKEETAEVFISIFRSSYISNKYILDKQVFSFCISYFQYFSKYLTSRLTLFTYINLFH